MDWSAYDGYHQIMNGTTGDYATAVLYRYSPKGQEQGG